MGFWVLLTWNFSSGELTAGVIVSLAAALFSARFMVHENSFWLLNPAKLFGLIYYVLIVFPVELVKANVDMAKRCFGGCKNVNPGIVKVPVNLESEYGQSMLANSITLTPGTITMDITEEEGQTYYYIHWIDVTAPSGAEAGDAIKGTLEKWVGRIFK
jgi:multicomponent Na+:H+ antiporter subunit E